MLPLLGIFFSTLEEAHGGGVGSCTVSEPLCLCKHEVVASSVQRLRGFTLVASLGVQQSRMPYSNSGAGAWDGRSAHC